MLTFPSLLSNIPTKRLDKSCRFSGRPSFDFSAPPRYPNEAAFFYIHVCGFLLIYSNETKRRDGMRPEFLQQRIAALELAIVAYEDAILQLSTGAVLTYSLDTGQTKQSVTKVDVIRMQAQLPAMYNMLTILETRLTGSGVVRVVPAW